MGLKDLPGQERAGRFLLKLASTGRIPHALLFCGMEGIGKKTAALEFARLVNCSAPVEGDACGRCNSCRKIGEGIHPDVMSVRSDGVFIKIDQVRAIQDRVRFRPVEGRRRVILIEEAQNVREEAANALLKLIEEPPDGNLFILTVVEPQMLLPTIVSRCCLLRFQPLDRVDIERLLKAEGMAPDTASQAAVLSMGSLSHARDLAGGDRLERRKAVLETLQRIARLPMLDFFLETERWAKESENPAQEIEWIECWIRDILLLRLTGTKPVFRPDARTLEAVKNRPEESFFLLYEKTEQARQSLRRFNANSRLTLESICLAVKDTLYG